MIKKHKITVTLDWTSINKDVQDKAYRMARLAKLGVDNTTAADRLESEITLGDEDMSLLKRAMSQGLAEVVTMCGQYVWNTSHTSDNYILDGKDVTITLMMPINFNLAGCESLGQMIHTYIVAKAMTEWFRYTVPARAAEQQELQNEVKRDIRKIINARVRTLAGATPMQIIVGDEKPSVTMLYCFDNENIEVTPSEDTYDILSTKARKVQFTASAEEPRAVAAALPLGYTPNIGNEEIKQLGKVVYDDMVYAWWTATSRFENRGEISY